MKDKEIGKETPDWPDHVAPGKKCWLEIPKDDDDDWVSKCCVKSVFIYIFKEFEFKNFMKAQDIYHSEWFF